LGVITQLFQAQGMTLVKVMFRQFSKGGSMEVNLQAINIS